MFAKAKYDQTWSTATISEPELTNLHVSALIFRSLFVVFWVKYYYSLKKAYRTNFSLHYRCFSWKISNEFIYQAQKFTDNFRYSHCKEPYHFFLVLVGRREFHLTRIAASCSKIQKVSFAIKILNC